MTLSQTSSSTTPRFSRQPYNHTNTSSLNFYMPDALPDAQLTVSPYPINEPEMVISKEHETLSQLTHYVISPLQFSCQQQHTFNGPLSRTTQVSGYQKFKTNPDFTEARDSEWQWHHLGHMQVCTALRSRQITTPAPSHLVFSARRMPFLPPNQQRQST